MAWFNIPVACNSSAWVCQGGSDAGLSQGAPYTRGHPWYGMRPLGTFAQPIRSTSVVWCSTRSAWLLPLELLHRSDFGAMCANTTFVSHQRGRIDVRLCPGMPATLKHAFDKRCRHCVHRPGGQPSVEGGERCHACTLRPGPSTLPPTCICVPC